MTKLVLFGGIAFLIGVGGSTSVLVMRPPAHAPGADSLHVAHADSAAHAAPVAVATVVAHAPAVPETTRASAPPQPFKPVDAVLAAHTPAIVAITPPDNAVHEGRSAELPDGETYKQVGTILNNMKPVEAAKIIGYMSDAQVEGLLRAMSPRNAATVLAQLPSERAASLSKRLLVPAAKELHP